MGYEFDNKENLNESQVDNLTDGTVIIEICPSYNGLK